MTNTIVINGVTISGGGQNVTIRNGKVIVDGKNVTPDAKEINIFVTGNVQCIEADACQKISVTGDAGSVITQSGNVEVGGAIGGNVNTMSGDIKSHQ